MSETESAVQQTADDGRTVSDRFRSLLTEGAKAAALALVAVLASAYSSSKRGGMRAKNKTSYAVGVVGAAIVAYATPIATALLILAVVVALRVGIAALRISRRVVSSMCC